MAILNKIRQRTVFLIFVIALALFAFVLMDVISNGGFSNQRSANTIAKIDGTTISREDFANQVENTTRQMGGNASTMQVVNYVWENMLNATLIGNQAEELGITISDVKKINTLGMALSQDPRFTNDLGQFDYDKYTAYLEGAKTNNPAEYYSFLQYEKQLEKNLKQETYLSLINAGLNASSAEGENEYRYQNDKVNIAYVQIPYASIADETITVTEEEIAEYIKKNPLKYQSEAAVDIQYVFFAEEPSEEDELTVKQEVEALLDNQLLYNAATKQNDTIAGFATTDNYSEFLAQYSDLPYNDRFVFKSQLPEEVADTIFKLNHNQIFGPFKYMNNYGLAKVVDSREMHDSIHVKHILITWKDIETGMDKSSKEDAKKLADSLLGVVRTNIDSFEELAKEFSNDPSVGTNGGDLGYIQPYEAIGEFNDFVIDSPAGSSAVVETEIGYHVISIIDKKNLQKVIKAPILLKAIEASETTMDKLFNEATTFENKASKDFIQAATEYNYEVKPVNGIKQFDENLPGIGNNREIVTWAFEKNTSVGAIRRFNAGGNYIVAQVTAKREKGLTPAYEVSPIVTPKLRNEKKAQIIRSGISGANLEEIATANNNKVRNASNLNRATPTIPGIGTEPKVVGAAFGMEKGEVSQPINGEFGVYVISLTEKIEASNMESYTSFAEQAKSKKTSNLSSRVLEALKAVAKIEDRRATFY